MKQTWFGRCIFLSWYCERGTCKFCFRSTIQHKIKHAKNAKRSIPSILSDALLGRIMGWRIEFLTGGYGIFSFDEIVDIAKKVSEIYGHKIWVNLGALKEEELLKLQPYVEGICASIECVGLKLHKEMCPDKPIEPYIEMLKTADKMGFKKSITIIIGMGETKDDLEELLSFIEKLNLERITFYALKPVKGTPFTKSPDPDYYSWWIKKTRERFPELEIMAGLTPKNPDYTQKILEAGATAITKFPAVRRFNSPEAQLVEKMVKDAGFEFQGSLTELPKIDWDEEVNKLPFEEKLKQQIREKLELSLNQMKKEKN